MSMNHRLKQTPCGNRIWSEHHSSPWIALLPPKPHRKFAPQLTAAEPPQHDGLGIQESKESTKSVSDMNENSNKKRRWLHGTQPIRTAAKGASKHRTAPRPTPPSFVRSREEINGGGWWQRLALLHASAPVAQPHHGHQRDVWSDATLQTSPRCNGTITASTATQVLGHPLQPVLMGPNTTATTTGQWRGIEFGPNVVEFNAVTGGGSRLEHCVIRYAGQSPSTGAILIRGRVPLLSGAVVRNTRCVRVAGARCCALRCDGCEGTMRVRTALARWVVCDGVVTRACRGHAVHVASTAEGFLITNGSQLLDSTQHGLFVEGSSATCASKACVLDGSTVARAASHGVYIYSVRAATAAVTLRDTTVTDCSSYGVRVYNSYPGRVTMTGMRAWNNGCVICTRARS